MNEKVIKRYLISDGEDKVCYHCHSNKPGPKQNICEKCLKELEAWKNKKNKKNNKVED